jgi:hypothetical protein
MTITKSILGIVMFAIQISIAAFYSATIDLKVIMGLGSVTFGYILYKFFTKKYDSA